MSGGSSTNNSWTILTPEETVTETLKPLAEGTEHHEETSSAAAGSGDKELANGEESAEGPPVVGHLVPEEKTAELSNDTSTEQHAPVTAALIDSPVPTSLEVSGSFVPDSDAFSQSEGLPEGLAQTSPDPDSFSDSYTHISPSPEESPASLQTTETLGGGEFTQEEERLEQEGTVYPRNGEELQPEEEESNLFSRTPDIGKQADSPDAEVTEESIERTGEQGEPEVRRRRSLLAALERIGRREEEEEAEEDFQLPPREEDSGFSLNKCILGAVILLGLGTIFISDSEYATRELKDAELPGKQEWFNPEVPPSPVDAESTELLNKLTEGNEQISVLQAQLQAQEEELKVAKGVVAEGAKERLRWEEVEKENSRLKKELASLPILQKANERMKRELESVVALQKELETLRSTVTELKLSPAANEASMSPPGGQPEHSTQVTDGSTVGQHKKPWDDQWEKKEIKKEEYYMKEKEKSIRREEARKDGGEWSKEKHEHAKTEKEKDKKKWHSDETKQRKEKDWKKDKATRGDEGKSWKDREGKKEWKDKNGRKEWKEEKDWKKGKHEKVKEGKQWRGKEEKKDWKVGKDNGGKYKSREEWKGEKEWKKGKEGGKEKWEKKDWKEKGEKKEWKKDGDWKSRNSKEWKGKGERKQWEDSRIHGKEWKGKEERKQWKESEWKSKNGKDVKDWKKKDEKKLWEMDEKLKREEKDLKKERKYQKHKFNNNHEKEHLWGDRKPPHSHHQPSLEQPEYWLQQRERLQHNLKPSQLCNSLESCANTEGLLPVPFPEFDAILQTYLAKAEEAGVDESKREELKKLVSEFFKDAVFVHDQMSFQDFVEDVGDILEDMVEGDEEKEDSLIEDEMEEFEREVLKKFAVPGATEKEERSKGEWRKESGRGHG
ncbi:pre-B-cell leukemia homeobox interacting protein 1b isoform X2 [Cheilinus undulatus]|uniref:pre-B-cell leukemia homeobox interacting protein 1b isoform X2 n=1 Tax=Cheilinus undulatus TaxID=241271 RepID=UPI001BD48AB1|nr:pre-B-cell leukemia homeobox interacting protein 1b isoform X2 [Cheilinus undulatus]